MLRRVSWVHVVGALAVSGTVLHVCPAQSQRQIQEAPPVQSLIVKYGGSAVTDKASFETLDSESLNKSSVQLKTVHTEKRWANIVIVHGAGSFGHFHAKKYDLKSGGIVTGSKEYVLNPWQTGLALTRQSVLKLNKHIVDAHVSLEMPVVSVSMFPSVVTAYQSSTGQSAGVASRPSINTYGSQIVEPGVLSELGGLLSMGLIPVLHGDVVLDRNQRCAILGGDHIIHW